MMARQVVVGAVWSVASRLLGRSIDLVTLLVLARMLTPADFGLVAVSMSLVMILEAVFELPVSVVLLRQPALDRADFDTAFTLAALRGLVLGLCALTLAWPFAIFYGEPRLMGLIAVLSLAPASRGLMSPRMVLFLKAMDFRSGFITDVAGRASACVLACATALATHSHWAIVVSTVAGPSATTLMSYVQAPYRPGFSLKRWPIFRAFFSWSSLAQLVSAVNWQSDRMLLGHLVPRGALGQFSMASDLAALPNQSLVAPLMTPTMSAFMRMEGERARLKQAYERSALAVVVIGLPALVGLSLTAEPLVAVILGGKWNNASPLLQWLALEAIPYLFTMPAFPLVAASGQMKVQFNRNLIELAIKLPLLCAGAMLFGIAGVVAARLIMSVVIAGVSMHFTRQLIGLGVMRQMLGAWQPIVATLVMAAVVAFARAWLHTTDYSALSVLIILGGLGAGTYAAASLALGVNPGRLLRAAAPKANVAGNQS